MATAPATTSRDLAGRFARGDNRDIMQASLEEKKAESNNNCKRKAALATENPNESMKKKLRSGSDASTSTMAQELHPNESKKLTATISSEQDVNAKLRLQIQALQAKIKELELEKERFKRVESELEKEMWDYYERVEVGNLVNGFCHKNIESLESDVRKLKDDVQAKEKDAKDEKIKHEAIQKKATTDFATLKQRQMRIILERDLLKQQLMKGTATILDNQSKAKAQMGMLDRALNDKTQRIVALEVEVEVHKTGKTDLLVTLAKAQTEVKAVRDNVDQCKKQQEIITAEKAAMAKEIGTFNEYKDVTKKVIKSLQVANNALESKVASLHQVENQEIAALKEDRDGWVKQAAMRDEVIENYVAQLVKLDPNFERKPAEWSRKK